MWEKVELPKGKSTVGVSGFSLQNTIPMAHWKGIKPAYLPKGSPKNMKLIILRLSLHRQD